MKKSKPQISEERINDLWNLYSSKELGVMSFEQFKAALKELNNDLMESYHQSKSKEEAQERYKTAKAYVLRYYNKHELNQAHWDGLKLAAFGKEEK